MKSYNIVSIKDHKKLIKNASKFFSEKWGIPAQAYAESMQSISSNCAVPQWYVALENDKIIAGLGVIENDFHNRKDLSPNVCAVFVNEECRCKGIAGEMLKFVCDDMKSLGVNTLYLITNHTSFYEKYGWEYLCMVQGEGEEQMSRMYVHNI